MNGNSQTRGWHLILIQVFAGNIVFGHLVRADLPPVGVLGILYTGDRVGLEGVPFREQLIDTFGIRAFNRGNSLQVPCLTARTRSHPDANCALAPGPLSRNRLPSRGLPR